jgi:hypothetical protein
MIIIQILVAVFFIGWFFGRRGKNESEKQNNQFKYQLDQEIQSTDDKKTLDALTRLRSLLGGRNSPINSPRINSIPQAEPWVEMTTTPQPTAPVRAIAVTDQVSVSTQNVDTNKTDTKNYVDNTSLLLYFGAFLFITSVGLFIGFAEVAGGLKTTLVALVAIVMYMFGFWMYKNKKQLKIVGEAFIGIGMSTIPFIGVTAYSFGSNQTNGTFIWLVTSAAALGLYGYTIMRLRSTFVSYLLLGSIVSLILSFAGIIDGPIYYYIWAAALVGITMQIISMNVASVPNLQEASKLSGQLFIPLSIAASLLSTSGENAGVAQLAVTIGLSAGYYTLLSVTEKQEATFYSVIAHALGIVTVALGTYSFTESVKEAGISLLAISLLHAGLLLVRKKWFTEAPEHSYVMIGASLVSVVLLLGSLTIATTALAMTFVLGSILAYNYKLLFGFQIALGSLIALSYACGQWLPHGGLSAAAQTILSLLFLLPIIYLLRINDLSQEQMWKESIRSSIAVGLVVGIGVALFSEAYPLLIISIVVALLCVVLYRLDKIVLWRQLEIVFAAVPLCYAVFSGPQNESSGYFTLTTVVFLMIAISASLRHKLLFARWASAVTWLLLPIALMNDAIGGITTTSNSVIALYGAVVVALSLSRALALGKFILKYKSNSAPLTSLTSHGSSMYFASMLLAAGIVAVSGFMTTNNTIGVISIAAVVAYLVFHFHAVEKSNFVASLMPYTLQLVLLRFLEPYTSQINNIETIYPTASFLVAITTHTYVQSIAANASGEPVPLSERKLVALSATYIAPLSVFFVAGTSWIMPFTAIIAVAVTLYAYRDRGIGTREQIGAVLLAAVFWQMYYFGITDIQIYAHMTATLVAFYAYMRHRHGQEAVSDSYIVVALCAATIPLTIEALSSGSSRGEMLGLWLLLEQVGFLVLGVTIRKPLLTRWGLYVGILAVLYQLRDLGWAMVAVLSLFIIGIAIFRALKQPEDNDIKEA